MGGKAQSGYDGFYHYLPVDDTAMLWGLYLTGLGSGKVAAGESYPPDGHPGLYSFDWSRGRVPPEFQVILISEGSGVFDRLLKRICTNREEVALPISQRIT